MLRMLRTLIVTIHSSLTCNGNVRLILLGYLRGFQHCTGDRVSQNIICYSTDISCLKIDRRLMYKNCK